MQIEISGFPVLFDEVNLKIMSKYNWTASLFSGIPYVYFGTTQGTLYLHRLLTSAPKGTYVDHINRNSLDNQLENLKVVTQSVNIANAGMFKSNTSGHRGVIWFRSAWRAQVKYHQFAVQSGDIVEPYVAALVRDEVARRLFGNITFENFPNQCPPNEYMPIVEGMVHRAYLHAA